MNKLQSFIESYNKEGDRLVEKLTQLFNFVDELFAENNKEVYNILLELIHHFDKPDNHSSELKTMLIITKPFKEHELLKEAREHLLATYNAKHTK